MTDKPTVEYTTVEALIFDRERLRAENERLRAALEQISRESGQVCPDFETCSHGPCQDG